MHYVAFVHQNGKGGYGVSFPDLPGCISAGDNMDEAITEGARALSLHIEGMSEEAQEIPHARSIEDIMSAPELADWRDGASLVLIPVVLNTGTSRRVNISLEYGLLKHIDEEARLRGVTRSAFLAGAAWHEIHCSLANRREQVGFTSTNA